MSARSISNHAAIILDACCVMNLYASQKMVDILLSISETVAVAAYVMDYEALSIYSVSKSDSSLQREKIDLHKLINDEVLIRTDLANEAEQQAFIDFAARRLDDGEAMTMAIAVNRDWAVATDDRAARRILAQRQKTIQLISTPELVQHWVETQKPDRETVRQALLNIEARANFLLGRRDPRYEWWWSLKSG